MIQIQRVSTIFQVGAAEEALWTRLFGELDFSPCGRLQPATSRAIWQHLAAPDWPARLRAALAALPPVPPPGGHSDAVVAIDERGNVVALLHTINTVLWGDTGLFVGGVSLSDVAGRQPAWLAATGAGFRVYDAGHPYLVLRGGKPVVASASVGRGLHTTAFQNVVNLLVYGMDPAASLAAPQTLGNEFHVGDDGRRPYDKERVYAGAFTPEVLAALAAMGQEVVLVERDDRQGLGYWAGLRIDPESGLIQASASAGGHAVGY